MALVYFRNLSERLRRPGGPPLYFRITNIAVALLMVVAGIVFFTWSNFLRIMLGVFEIVFGVWIIMFELAEMAWLAPYVQFMFTWRGRGIFYVFMGCLTLGYRALGWVFGSIIIAVGIVFLVLSFTVKRHESYVSGAGPGHGGSETMYADSSRVNKGMPAPGMYGSAAGMDPYAMQGQQPSAQHAHTQISQTQYTSGQFGNAPTRDYLHSAV